MTYTEIPRRFAALTVHTCIVHDCSTSPSTSTRELIGWGLLIAKSYRHRWRFELHSGSATGVTSTAIALAALADRLPAQGVLIGWNWRASSTSICHWWQWGWPMRWRTSSICGCVSPNMQRLSTWHHHRASRPSSSSTPRGLASSTTILATNTGCALGRAATRAWSNAHLPTRHSQPGATFSRKHADRTLPRASPPRRSWRSGADDRPASFELATKIAR